MTKTFVSEGWYISNKWHDTVNGYTIFQEEFCLHDGILLRGMTIVIPIKLRQRVLQAAQEGHPGIVAVKNRIRTKVW